MAHLIVEREYDLPLTEEQRLGAASRLGPCLGTHGVRWMRSYLSLDRRKMVCEFEAPDADRLRTSFRSAQIEFVRMWPAELFTP